MKQKLMDLLAKMKPGVQKAISIAPLPMGIVIGYMGHGVIKVAIDVVMGVVHMVIG